MASVLCHIGYGPVHSLQSFLSRFSLEERDLGKSLSRVWICHKSKRTLSQFESSVNKNNLDEMYHTTHSTSRTHTFRESSQFNGSEIVHDLFEKLPWCLAHYIMDECLILYNWGLNAFELIVEDEEVYRKIREKMEKQKKKKWLNNYLDLKRWKYVLTCRERRGNPNNKVLNLQVKKMIERGQKQGRRRQRGGKMTRKEALRIREHCEKPYLEPRRNDRDPLQEVFNKDRILYSLKQGRWPEGHALSALNVEDMFSIILKVGIRTEATGTSGGWLESSLEWRPLKQILCDMLGNHGVVQVNDGYGRILKRHLRSAGFPTNRPEARLRPIPYDVVMSYVRDIIRRLIPMDFFGSNRVRKLFQNQIRRIVYGRKSEDFFLDPIAKIFLTRKRELLWLRNIGHDDKAKLITVKVIKWLVTDVILVLLQNHFYLTETGSSGYRLLYYRKRDVESRAAAWLRTQVSKRNVRRARAEDLTHWMSTERLWLETGVIASADDVYMERDNHFIYPVAKVRFLPKTDTNGELRMITNFPRRKTVLGRGVSDARVLAQEFATRVEQRQKYMKKVKLMLQLITLKHGTGIRPLPGNPRLRMAWRKAIRLKEVYGCLYYVKADISDAFGSVLQDKLCQIILGKIDGQYPDGLQLRMITECHVRYGMLASRVRESFADHPMDNHFLLSRSFTSSGPRRRELPSYDPLHLNEALDQIIQKQYLRISGHRYRLLRGLTQGSSGTLSPLLCEVYYSEMDNIHFRNFITCPECVLVRGVDDYLLITSSVMRATEFYDAVYDGIKDFNVTFKREKLMTNLRGGPTSFSYLGLRFDVTAMTVKPDYARYCGKDLLSTVRLTDQFKSQFFEKNRFVELRTSCLVPLKLHMIVLQSDMVTVREVVYAACLLQALRVFVLSRHLSSSHEENDLGVCVVLSAGLSRILRRVRQVNRRITREEVSWLFWTAAEAVFRRFSGTFPAALVVLRHRRCIVEMGMKRAGKKILLADLRRGLRSWDEVRQTFRDILAGAKRRIRPRPAKRVAVS